MNKALSSLMAFYPPLGKVVQALEGGNHRVFLVGGALRDYCLGRAGRDLDFAVDKGAVGLARQLARRIRGAFVLLDAKHGSARVVKDIDGQAWTFDLTDWRAKTIAADLALRDFTINAQALDIFGEGGKWLEVKDAGKDLKAGLVRMVKPGAFRDDPLRLLRAYSLSAAFGFKIHSNTVTQIKKEAHLIASVSAERIREEVFKVLSSPRASVILADMDKAGLLSRVIPQLTVMHGVHQGGYHHLDVWQHSLEVVHQLEEVADRLKADDRINAYLQEIIGGAHDRLSLLKMAALLHDIGKPETRRKEGDRMTFHGHEHAGQRIARQVARQLKVSTDERYFLENAVRMHLRPGYLANFKRPSGKAVFRYFRDSKQEAASLAILALADQAATCGPLTTKAHARHHAKTCHQIIGRYFEKKAETRPKERLITGHDLIKGLGLKPSPLFGKILSLVEEAAALGKINTKAQAMALAHKIAAVK